MADRHDRQKIILMSKLASYDKYHAKGDRRKTEFFRHDYVYRQNLTARFYTLIGSIIVVLFYFLHRMVIDHLDFLDIESLITDLIISAAFIILVQLLYSLLGFVIHSRDYNASADRIEEYTENMKALAKLDSLNPKKMNKSEEGSYGYYEPNDDEYYQD